MQQPSTEDVAKWDRCFAVELNNLAWTLAEKTDRAPAEREEMLHAAHASAFHWSRVGTELNKARADMLLGYVHVLLGNGSIAMVYAWRGYEYVTSHESADWEVASAHVVLAHAVYAAKDISHYAQHYALARNAGEAIAGARDRDVFQRLFAQLPVPQDVPKS